MVTVYRGRGDGTFQQWEQIPVGTQPTGGVVGDFTGNGNLDIAVVNSGSSDLSVLLSQGDGTFHASLQTAITVGPVALASADFNSDGNLDLVSVNPTTGNMQVSLGNGDGTFQTPSTIPLGGEPMAVITGDFNNDGRPDIAVANYQTNTVSILLGIGDGTFEAPVSYAVGDRPDALVAGNFTCAGILDLAVANFGSGTISILRGRGDGTFTFGQQIAVGKGPVGLAVANVNGATDLVVANSLSRSLSILQEAGNGTFHLAATIPLGYVPGSVVAGDFTGNGRVDIATTDQADNAVSVLLGNSDGTFGTPVHYPAGRAPVALVAGDFNGDGRLDLAVANNDGNTVTVLQGMGDGTFRAATPFAVGSYPLALLAGDFNNDGRQDVATLNGLGQTLSVGLSLGCGAFVDASAGAHPIRSTPLVGDLTGAGLTDVAILAGNGQILVRFADPRAPGLFKPPIVLNPDPAESVRDLTLITVRGRLELAALSARTNAIWFYSYTGGSQFVRAQGPAIPAGLPVQIVAGDLTGDGLQDLVVAVVGRDSGQVAVYLQQPSGDFGPASYQCSVGVSPADLTLANLTGGPGPDIVVTDQYSGEIYVLRHTGTAPFWVALPFRAGTGRYDVDPERTTFAVQSDSAPSILAVVPSSSGMPELVVLNRGSDQFDVLGSDSQGGLFNPVTSATYAAGTSASALVAGDFTGDGITDLAILDQGSAQVLIYLGDGHGGFVPAYVKGPDGKPIGLQAGNAPDGLTLADLTGNGRLDLLVGNANGDVLTLFGNGDGTFQPYQRLDGHVALAAADVDGDGLTEFVVADQAHDQITLLTNQPGGGFEQDRQNGVLSPNAVVMADLTGNGIQDLIVANGGGNDVLVYLGLGDGRYGPAHRFFVGTDPVSITVADLNGDGIPDLLVANRGSNDVSILYGQNRGASWTLTPGPRLRAGAGPVATAVQDVYGNGLPDILVSNSESNNVYLLPGVGGGFFNDKHPVIFATGQDPEQLFVGHFGSGSALDLVTVNRGSNDLTFFPGFGIGRSLATGGQNPTAAVAGDFLHDGRMDLIVVNSGDNHVALLLAGAEGPQIASVLTPANRAAFSDAALGAVSDNAVDVYVSTEADAVTQLTFALDLGPTLPVNPTVLENTPSRAVAEFAALPDLPQSVVATLLLEPMPSHTVADSTSPSDPTQGAVARLFRAPTEELGADLSNSTAVAASATGAQLPGLTDLNARAALALAVLIVYGGDQSAEPADVEATRLAPADPAAVPAVASVELNAFITGSATTVPGRPLLGGSQEKAPLLNSVLPTPGLFDFSDVPAVSGPRQERERETAPAPAAADKAETRLVPNPAPVPDSSAPELAQAVEPVAAELSAMLEIDGAVGQAVPASNDASPRPLLPERGRMASAIGSVSGGIRGLTLLFGQALLGPWILQRPRRDDDINLKK
jgi:hypothetical protein